MRNTLSTLPVVILFTRGCGRVESVGFSDVTAVRSSDDFVTVQVTLKSNGHLEFEGDDEFCVEARWHPPAVQDGGVAETDAGAMADAGVRLVPSVLVDSASGCSTKMQGFDLELKSTKDIPRPAVLRFSSRRASGSDKGRTRSACSRARETEPARAEGPRIEPGGSAALSSSGPRDVVTRA
ncbi:MAG: hypothetical protein INH41_28705 [Myxococcaceae bacterium]|nr:hypothetical protein [Myxococcaceae bacterium]MCA3016383.1 hypothetical protein [Myxococcaceae bacterium]